ncbi:MAG: UvrD-helicase domain-containing protein [Ardenticatenaceae bacterium]|nr:UvrD-helicase domain-containing protein [Ardenticatenaceae bacterium]
MDILHGLNDAQKTAVSTPPGPVLVLAGPGSGKTRVLTFRITYLIRQLNVSPWHIMAVTFTNKAAREMNERIEQLLDGQPRGLLMGTFHATCARILRRESDNLTHYQRDFVIFDTDDQLQVVKQALKDLNLDDKKFPPYKMLNGISNAKNELITPQEYAASNYIAAVTQRVYERYQEILYHNNAMDFDDLLMNTVMLFDERPDVLQKYQERYQHILVDEFQDTNTAQYALLKRLAARHHNIFVVGDSDQSIYKWRGADVRNINRFREAYPEAEVILLEQNYRSTQLILDAAKSVIRNNSNRIHKDLFTERQGGDPIALSEAYDEREEAETVVNAIQGLLLQGYALSDTAVMYRTNAQSRALEEGFMRVGIPYRLVGATQFYKRREVKDILAYLRLVHNPADSVSFNRIINTPTRGIGSKTQQMLVAWAQQNGWLPTDALVKLALDPDVQHPFSGRAFNALHNFGEMYHVWQRLYEQEISVGDLFDTILQQTQYRDYLEKGAKDSDEYSDRWGNVMELRNTATETAVTLTEFLENAALVSETDNLEEGIPATTLLTLHAAKGLEFPVVFIVGLEDGILPHSRSLDTREDLDEERRLFYVGITRAKDRLYLSHAFRRTVWGQSDASTPSRFLREIPDDLLAGANTKARRQQTKTRASSWNWSANTTSQRTAPAPRATPPRPAAHSNRGGYSLPTPNTYDDPEPSRPTTPQFRSGQRVRHAKFGEGTVIQSKLTGNDEEVHVAFAGEGVKRLAASFAKLEKIDD